MLNEEKYTADELRIIKFFVSEFTAEELPEKDKLCRKNSRIENEIKGAIDNDESGTKTST